MKRIVIGLAIVLAIIVSGHSAFGGPAININYATVDTDAETLSLHGINFDAFGTTTVTIGATILEVCTITATMIECDLNGTPALTGGTWTVYVSAGNAPHMNDEIDAFIPFGLTIQLCNPGNFVQCYSGDAATRGVGECQSGTSTCLSDGTWDACVGEVLPQVEICDDGLDNDCDGQTDNGCPECSPGDLGLCYSGNAATQGVGECQSGTSICLSDGTWDACVGEVLPQAEFCDGLDNDCNGTIDEGGVCDGQACDDGNLCTMGDIYVGGVCQGQLISCDDGNECTSDSCHPSVGCAYSYNNGFPCGDHTNTVCTSPDTCQEGVCMPNDASNGTMCIAFPPTYCDGIGNCG